jgi:DNA-binding transcriptional LysR family regulator
MVMDVHGRDLRYFVTVAEELHFTRAAERLFVSQPALSKQVRMLERQLGAPLFERDRQGVRLTQVGAALLPHARQVLASSAGTTRTAGLAGGTADVAFVWLPVPDPGRYSWVVVAEEPCLVAMPLTHRLASREVVDFTDLLDEPFLALPAGAGPLRDYWLALDARDGRPPRIGAEIASTDETYEALVGGQGICLVAAGNAPLIALEGVITRPVRGLSPSQLALAWRTGDHRPLVMDYARACRQAAQRTK